MNIKVAPEGGTRLKQSAQSTFSSVRAPVYSAGYLSMQNIPTASPIPPQGVVASGERTKGARTTDGMLCRDRAAAAGSRILFENIR